ncbi:MAG: hypothetical protein ACT6RD_11135 [Brevundimonas sp.]|uniref:hypothetical protein n=1 Tax=Brevundimonas sp. TaxID=1871086 RepID=UPI0040339BCC
MTAVLFVLSLLVFAAGLVAWAVHMRGVWASEANWVARRRSLADTPSPVIDPPAASTDDAVPKEARP